MAGQQWRHGSQTTWANNAHIYSHDNKTTELVVCQTTRRTTSWVRLKNAYVWGTSKQALQCALPCLILENVLVVRCIHLLQEDECQHSVWPETGVVWGKSLPQTEESFFANHLHQNILPTTNNQHKNCQQNHILLDGMCWLSHRRKTSRQLVSARTARERNAALLRFFVPGGLDIRPLTTKFKLRRDFVQCT